jgi:hypothetical protein
VHSAYAVIVHGVAVSLVVEGMHAHCTFTSSVENHTDIKQLDDVISCCCCISLLTFTCKSLQEIPVQQMPMHQRSLSTLTLFRTGWLVGIEPTCVWAHVPRGEIDVVYLNATFMIPKQNLRINRSCCFCFILINK